jgi:RNA polymerase sigma-70 factor (ECF subfamily)
MATSTESEPSRAPEHFVTTHWSVVMSAGRNDTPRAHDALEKLCKAYWYPLYAYVRRRGYSPHDAQDLTQGFFQCLLERESLASADRNRGRFRSFILGAMNHYLADDWAKSRTQKRGGGEKPLSLDLVAAEQRFKLEAAESVTPDKAFDRQWATTVLDEVLKRLEKEYADGGKAALFAALKLSLTSGRASGSHAEAASRLGMSEGAARMAVHRLRKRYRELLRAEIANTVVSPGDVKEEMGYLFTTVLDG